MDTYREDWHVTPDYKRGYSKGYNTGRGDTSKIEMRHWEECQAVAERAERAEAAAGLGHCDECRHWERACPVCAWGYCNASKQAGSPWGCWAQGPSIGDGRDLGRISTTPKFGCVMFAVKQEPSDAK